MKCSFEEVLETLPNFEKKELEELRARVNFLIDFSDDANSEMPEEPMFYESMQTVVQEVGGSIFAFKRFKKSNNYAIYRKNLPIVLDFVNGTLPGMQRVEKRGLYKVLSRILIRRMREMQIPITVGALCRNLIHIPAYAEVAFPGYAENGMLKFLAEQK